MTEKKKQPKPSKKAEETEKRVEVEGEELVMDELEKVSGGVSKAPYVPIGAEE